MQALHYPTIAIRAAAAELDEEIVALVRRAQAGDEASFAALYGRYAPELFRLVSGRAGIRAREALRVTHEVFVHAKRHIAEYDPASIGFRDWLLALAPRNRRGAPIQAPLVEGSG